MTDEAKLYRCMGGNRCNHVPGTCTATNTEYQAKAKEKQLMTDDHNGREQTFRDTERNLRDLIETQAREIERLREALKSFQELASEQAQELSRYRAKHMVGTSAALGDSHDQ